MLLSFNVISYGGDSSLENVQTKAQKIDLVFIHNHFGLVWCSLKLDEFDIVLVFLTTVWSLELSKRGEHRGR